MPDCLPSWDAVFVRGVALDVGVPVKPMLAKPTRGVHVVLDRFANVPFTCEYKYDGQRAQVREKSPSSTVHRLVMQGTAQMTAKHVDSDLSGEGVGTQIHMLEDRSVRIYSRNLENHTEVPTHFSFSLPRDRQRLVDPFRVEQKYPDIVGLLPTLAAADRARSYILDTEVVAYDLSTGRILPFQILSTRAKKVPFPPPSLFLSAWVRT